MSKKSLGEVNQCSIQIMWWCFFPFLLLFAHWLQTLLWKNILQLISQMEQQTSFPLIRGGKLCLECSALQLRTLTSEGKKWWQGEHSKKILVSLSKVTWNPDTWGSLPLGGNDDRCFTVGNSLHDFQCDLGQKDEPFSFLHFMLKLPVLFNMEGTNVCECRNIREEHSSLRRVCALWGRSGVPHLIWWQVRWEEEMSVFVVGCMNRTEASEVWSDHNRLIHVLEVEQEEMFLCNLSSKSQECFWLQAN